MAFSKQREQRPLRTRSKYIVWDCQRKIREMDWMLEVEKVNLTRIVNACDMLKKQTLDKIAALPKKELCHHQDYLTMIATSTADDEDQRDVGLDVVTQRIGDLHEAIQKKYVLKSVLQESTIMEMNFYQTELPVEYQHDQIFMDFSKDASFPPALLIGFIFELSQDFVFLTIGSRPCLPLFQAFFMNQLGSMDVYVCTYIENGLKTLRPS